MLSQGKKSALKKKQQQNLALQKRVVSAQNTSHERIRTETRILEHGWLRSYMRTRQFTIALKLIRRAATPHQYVVEQVPDAFAHLREGRLAMVRLEFGRHHAILEFSRAYRDTHRILWNDSSCEIASAYHRIIQRLIGLIRLSCTTEPDFTKAICMW